MPAPANRRPLQRRDATNLAVCSLPTGQGRRRDRRLANPLERGPPAFWPCQFETCQHVTVLISHTSSLEGGSMGGCCPFAFSGTPLERRPDDLARRRCVRPATVIMVCLLGAPRARAKQRSKRIQNSERARQQLNGLPHEE